MGITCDLLQVLNIEASHRGTLLRYVRLLLTAKQHRRALVYATRAIAEHPDNFELNLLHADCLRSEEKALWCQSPSLQAACLPGHALMLCHSG